MEKTIEINGMTCGHCAARVKKELEKIEGVSSAEVSAADRKAVVTLNADVTAEELKKAVEEAGYEFVKIV